MMVRLGLGIMNFMRKALPEAFVIAIGITIIVAVAGMAAGNSIFDMGLYWGKGFWNLLTFMVQASLTLILGSAMIRSGIGGRFINRIAMVPKSCSQAAILIAAVSMALYYVNWGVGMIGGALLARQIAINLHRKRIPVHYPILGAAVYVGILGYEAGFSGAIQLQVATEGHVLAEQMGVIPLTETLFNPLSYVTFIGLLVIIPVLLGIMSPKKEEDMLTPDLFLESWELEGNSENKKSEISERKTFAETLDGARIINLLFLAFSLIYIIYYLKNTGLAGLDLNIVNLILLALCLLFHESPKSLIDAFQKSTSSASGILMQFPLYAGIMGMMTASGLVGIIADFFVSISTVDTYPVFTFLSAGILNVFIPSGGGQWAVQGPIMIEASKVLNVDFAKTVIAVSWGDVWTNMIQPFWVLPIVGLMGGKARDYLGYTALLLIVSGIWITAMLLIL